MATKIPKDFSQLIIILEYVMLFVRRNFECEAPGDLD